MNELKNYKGGIVGVFMACAIYALLHFAGLMLAFGSTQPRAVIALNIISSVFIWIPPPAGIAIGYAFGAFSLIEPLKKGKKN